MLQREYTFDGGTCNITMGTLGHMELSRTMKNTKTK